eukprot:gene12407-8516_t
MRETALLDEGGVVSRASSLECKSPQNTMTEVIYSLYIPNAIHQTYLFSINGKILFIFVSFCFSYFLFFLSAFANVSHSLALKYHDRRLHIIYGIQFIYDIFIYRRYMC